MAIPACQNQPCTITSAKSPGRQPAHLVGEDHSSKAMCSQARLPATYAHFCVH